MPGGQRESIAEARPLNVAARSHHLRSVRKDSCQVQGCRPRRDRHGPRPDVTEVLVAKSGGRTDSERWASPEAESRPDLQAHTANGCRRRAARRREPCPAEPRVNRAEQLDSTVGSAGKRKLRTRKDDRRGCRDGPEARRSAASHAAKRDAHTNGHSRPVVPQEGASLGHRHRTAIAERDIAGLEANLEGRAGRRPDGGVGRRCGRLGVRGRREEQGNGGGQVDAG